MRRFRFEGGNLASLREDAGVSLDDKPSSSGGRPVKLLMAFLIGCAPAVYMLANIRHYFAFDGNLKDAELFALLAGVALCALIAGYIVASIYPENGRAADRAIYTLVFGIGFAVLDGCIACVGCASDVVLSIKR